MVSKQLLYSDKLKAIKYFSCMGEPKVYLTNPRYQAAAVLKNSPDRGLRSSPQLDPDLG